MKNSLVIYYSWSGTTQRVAEIIAEQTGSELLRLQPKQPYPKSYYDTLAQAKRELRTTYRPDLLPFHKKIAQYETLFLGTPNWCGMAAPPLTSFLYQIMPCDKNIVPFCTHGGGGVEQVADDIARYCLGCDIFPILTIENGSKQEETQVKSWLEQIRPALNSMAVYSNHQKS